MFSLNNSTRIKKKRENDLLKSYQAHQKLSQKQKYSNVSHTPTVPTVSKVVEPNPNPIVVSNIAPVNNIMFELTPEMEIDPNSHIDNEVLVRERLKQKHIKYEQALKVRSQQLVKTKQKQLEEINFQKMVTEMQLQQETQYIQNAIKKDTAKRESHRQMKLNELNAQKQKLRDQKMLELKQSMLSSKKLKNLKNLKPVGI